MSKPITVTSNKEAKELKHYCLVEKSLDCACDSSLKVLSHATDFLIKIKKEDSKDNVESSENNHTTIMWQCPSADPPDNKIVGKAS